MKGVALALACVFASSSLVGYGAQGRAQESAGARDTLRACLELGPGRSTECAQAVMPGLLARQSVAEVNSALLWAVADAGSSGGPSCHGMSETIGTAWARKSGVSALGSLQYSCLGGPMHGVFYELGRRTPGREMAELSTGICEDFGKGKPWVVGWDCRHGVGHSLGLNPDTSPQEAFELCAVVYARASDRDDCGTGVMASILSREQDRPAEMSRDPRKWCSAHVREDMRNSCLTRAAFMSQQSGKTLRQIALECRSGDLTCAYAVGYAAGTPYHPYSPQERAAPCLLLASRPAGEACVYGLVRNLTPDYWLVEQDPGVCAALLELSGACREETARMHRRELTIRQLTGDDPAPIGDTEDPAGWPR